MQKIQVRTYDSSINELPQAANCIDFFRKRFLSKFNEELNSKIWIAGGAVRDYFSDGVISKDVDFFCTDRKAMAELVLELRRKFKYKHYLITKNAIKGYGEVFGKRIDIDIVKKGFANPVVCIDAFDFTVCMFGVSYNSFYYHLSSPFDLMKKRLVIHNIPHPVDSLKRMNKYVKKGFSACNGTILTIAKQINQLEPEKEDIFEFYKFD